MRDGLVIMGDFNQYVRSKTISDWKNKLGLHDKLIEKVEKEGAKLNTYSRGKVLIDTILTTYGIEVTKAGYLSFGEGVGDHRPILMDISIESSLGLNLPPLTSMKARRLKVNDPRVMKRCNNNLKVF